MAEKSLFAVLLRSPWWISFVVVGLITLASGALLPREYFVVGALSSFPIFVVGCIAAWRQLRAPSPDRVAEILDAVNSMPSACKKNGFFLLSRCFMSRSSGRTNIGSSR